MGRLNFDMDDDVHRMAKAAAALVGVSLKAYIERVLAEQAAKDLDEAARRGRR